MTAKDKDRREKEIVKLRGSALKGEKHGRKMLIYDNKVYAAKCCKITDNFTKTYKQITSRGALSTSCLSRV